MLTAEEKRALNDAAAALYYISTDDNGIHHIDLYADYSDTNEGLLQLAYNHRMDNREQTIPDEGESAGIIDVLKAQINHWYDNTICSWRTWPDTGRPWQRTLRPLFQRRKIKYARTRLKP